MLQEAAADQITDDAHGDFQILMSSLSRFGAAHAAERITYQIDPTHHHLVIQADPGVGYSVEKTLNKGSKAQLLKVRLENLPNGWIQSAPKGLKITASGPGFIELEIAVQPKSKSSELEYFDYRNRSTSAIVLDFWWKDAQGKPPVASKSVAATVKSAKAKQTGRTSSKVIAGPSQKTAKGGKLPSVLQRPDDKVGCANPLLPEKDGIAQFKVLHRHYDYAAFFKVNDPDEGYRYPQVKRVAGETFEGRKKDEINHYRLAHKLYREKDFGLALRTISFFEEKYPQSELRPEIEFLKANLFVQLSKRLYTPRYRELSLEVFKHLWIDAPDSEIGKRSLKYLTVQTIGSKPPAEVLEYMVAGESVKTYQKGDLTPWVYRLGMAESLYDLGEYDRAERFYQNVMDDQNAVSPDAAYRLGDVFAARKLWERAVFAYERALRLFPAQANGYAPVWLNLAEGYFRLGQLDDAAKYYQAYIEKFPKDVDVWAPKLRLAEIAQMKLPKTDPTKREEIRAGYERVVNENPYTPGEILAHLRLSVCGHNPEFFDEFFKKRPDFAREKRVAHEILYPAQVELWMDLAEARYYLWSGSYEKVLSFANKYGVKLPIMELGPSFKHLLSAALAAMVGQISRNEGKSNLLELVEEYSDYAPQPEPFGYSLAILRSFQARNNLQAVAQRLVPLEGRLKEATPDEKDWFLFTKAKHLKATGIKAEDIIQTLDGVREDGVLGLEKLDLLSEAHLLKGDVEGSIGIDSKAIDDSVFDSQAGKRMFHAQEFKPAMLMKFAGRRIENLYKLGRHADVVRKVDAASFQLGAYPEFAERLARLREYRALSLYEVKNYKLAVSALQEVLKDTKEGPRRAEFEFKLGKSLISSGQRKEGFDTFRGLAKATTQDSPGIWKKSAQAELDQYEWEQGISKELTGKKDRRSLK